MTGHYVVMGVSGCGKSLIGRAFADRIGARFVDGDSLHPAPNVAKMAGGQPLTDADRAPWLDDVARALARPGTVVACSALRRAYRDRIRDVAGVPVVCLFLDGDRTTLLERVSNRPGHFMPPALLDSQLATLERPAPPEAHVTARIEATPAQIVEVFLAGVARVASA